MGPTSRRSIARPTGRGFPACDLQNVGGIFGAVGSDWPGTETERRLELQASCLADVFLSSQRDAYPVAEQYWEWQDTGG